MRIADRRTARAAATGLVLVLALTCARAHPVAMGALDVVVRPDQVEIHARVSLEEVLVASSVSPQARPLAEQIHAHGAYLARHIWIVADGTRIVGTASVSPSSSETRPTYRIVYPISPFSSRLVLDEDVLREIEFAPGNPWEASYVVQIQPSNSAATSGLLLSSRQPVFLAARDGALAAGDRGGPWQMIVAFICHGVMHILTGYDHLLFVTALVLAVRGAWDLVRVITAFTVAHTVTLTLAALDIFRLSSRLVEPMIALSIVFVALQNVVWPEQSRSRGRLVVAFLFGLFHGLGFAGGLLEAMTDMTLGAKAWAIGAFSVGVELGHQIVVVPVFGLLWLVRRQREDPARWHRLTQQYGSAVIFVCGLFYLLAAFPT